MKLKKNCKTIFKVSFRALPLKEEGGITLMLLKQGEDSFARINPDSE